jgi:hypothetical protein
MKIFNTSKSKTGHRVTHFASLLKFQQKSRIEFITISEHSILASVSSMPKDKHLL